MICPLSEEVKDKTGCVGQYDAQFGCFTQKGKKAGHVIDI